MNEDQITELTATGRTYVSFDFGTDLALLVPQILTDAAEAGIDPTVHLSGSFVLLVENPDHDPDQEEG